MCNSGKSRTPWSVVVKVANRVSGSDAVDVVRAQGREYDDKIGDLVESVLKEVFIKLNNDEIGVDRNSELNELVHEELQTQARTENFQLLSKLAFKVN